MLAHGVLLVLPRNSPSMRAVYPLAPPHLPADDKRKFMLKRPGPAIPFLLSLLLAPLLSAQESPPAPPPADNAIHLDVVVTPKSGAPVPGLEQKDFTVLDNKIQQPITAFKAVQGSEAPVEIILLIDAVNTSYTNIAYERSEIDKLLRSNGGRLTHPASLAIFTDAGVRMQDNFSTDGNGLAATLDQETVALRSITRSAGFYGAEDRFSLSMRVLAQLGTNLSARPGRKLIFWISPGWPLLTGPSVQLDSKQQQRLFAAIVQTSTELREAQITIYNINPLGATENTLHTFYYQEFVKGVTKPQQVNVANLSLQVLAEQTGGLVLNANNDISAMLEQAFRDADAWYEISFQPAASEPNEYHHLEVKVDKPGLIARTRQGYYALR
jgi:VWFA-related protein